MAIAKSIISVEVSSASVLNVTATLGSSATNTLDNTDEVDAPPAKKMTIWSCFDDMLVCADSSCNTTVVTNKPNGTSELSQYMSEPLLSCTDDTLVWWQMNRSCFPLLAKVTRAYLGVPPTSVPSERLLSTAGDIISDHHARILPDNAEKLIFLKLNIPMIDGDW